MSLEFKINQEAIKSKAVAKAQVAARAGIERAAREALDKAAPDASVLAKAEASLWADLFRIFQPVRSPRRADGRIAILHRVYSKRTPPKRIPASMVAIRAYHARVSKKFGRANAGYNAAARAVGWRPPGWIARHGAREGEAQWSSGESGVRLRMRNLVKYAARVPSIKGKLSGEMRMIKALMVAEIRARLS